MVAIKPSGVNKGTAVGAAMRSFRTVITDVPAPVPIVVSNTQVSGNVDVSVTKNGVSSAGVNGCDSHVVSSVSGRDGVMHKEPPAVAAGGLTYEDVDLS